jgi:hypothetical protein
MSIRPAIRRIIYSRGLVIDPSDRQGLETTVLQGPKLLHDIIDSVFENDLLNSEGTYGIPDAGEPVQVDLIEIEHEQGTTKIVLYNRAIMLFQTNEEIYRRIHKLCCIIEKHTGCSSATEKSRTMADEAHRGVSRMPAHLDQEPVYQLRVALLETAPPIWRRFVVPSGVTLHRLHLILQEVMGWTNSHLYSFKIGTNEYAEPNLDNELYELPFKNSKRVKLNQLLKNKGKPFQYVYDFGDNWIHQLVVEDVLRRDPFTRYPSCLAGERACPPEDCGGVHGYAELLKTISDPGNEDYVDTMTWLGGHFDSEAFQIEAVNKRLHSMHVR